MKFGKYLQLMESEHLLIEGAEIEFIFIDEEGNEINEMGIGQYANSFGTSRYKIRLKASSTIASIFKTLRSKMLKKFGNFTIDDIKEETKNITLYVKHVFGGKNIISKHDLAKAFTDAAKQAGLQYTSIG